MLVSTHDMRLVQELFPRTIVMDDGRIVADGRTKDILENETAPERTRPGKAIMKSASARRTF
jgi:energy-coupling factor transporter ATP-binding protein EcfA2